MNAERWLDRIFYGASSFWMLFLSALCVDVLWMTITGDISDYAKSLPWWQMAGIQIGLVVGMLALGAMSWKFWIKARRA